MSEPRRGFDSVLADLLADLANRSLDLDPAARARLEGVEGRQVQITADLPPPLQERHFTLTVSAGRLRFFPHAAEHPQVIVRGTPVDLAAWLIAGEGASARRLEIQGDGTLLSELRAALVSYRPDFASPMSRFVGQDLAQSALGTAELALAGLRSVLEGTGQTLREGASHAFVDHPELARLLDQIDDLQLRVDRLTARVQAEEQRRTPP